MNFIAIDVETANPDLASVCQIGVVVFRGGEPVERWCRLVKPTGEFHPYHTRLHGINAAAVEGMPVFAERYAELSPLMGGAVVASHGHFDRVAVGRASAWYGLEPPICRWVDTVRAARRAWPVLSGHDLAAVSAHLGIDLRHHDAGSDALSSGLILTHAAAASGLAPGDYLEVLAANPPGSADQTGKPIALKGDPDVPLAGEVVVFTGSLSLSRKEAAVTAAAAGCDVAPNVTLATTLLVVGDRDLRYGGERSNKHAKAETLAAKG